MTSIVMVNFTYFPFHTEIFRNLFILFNTNFIQFTIDVPSTHFVC